MTRAAKRLSALSAAAAVAVCLGCPAGEEKGARPEAAAAAPAPVDVRFVDVTERAGIAFRHETGAFGKKYLPETMGSGCAFLDYDVDGSIDLFLVNGSPWPGRRERGGSGAQSALYRNRGDGTFEDVTVRAKLAVASYGLGVSVGDYDNDGRPDLFVNALGPDHLYRNRGDGTFEDVTARAGVSDPAFGSSAAFLDYDRDGRLDLFVCNYVAWSPETDIFCTLDGRRKSYCTPESYPGATNRLYRNRGDGTFEDVTRAAGVWNDDGKSLGVVVFDHDGDGWVDLAVANDTQPNALFRNNGDGTFREIGRESGIAFSESGAARGAMGIDAADYDGVGRESLLIGNFSNEMIALYHNEGNGLYVDDAASSGVGVPSLLTLAFGAFFFDFDLDGALDIFVANGHVEPDIGEVQKDVSYAERPHLFRNIGGGRFEEATGRAGADLQRPIVARGAAHADIDGDGDLDLLVTTNGGPAILLKNVGGSGHRWLRVTLVGTKSARDGYGARLVLTRTAGAVIGRTVRSGSSYCSQSERTVTFGLGEDTTAARLEVQWPSGLRQTFTDLIANQNVTIVEGESAPRKEPDRALDRTVPPHAAGESGLAARIRTMPAAVACGGIGRAGVRCACSGGWPMRRTLFPLCALTLLALAVTLAAAKAPRSKDVMRPVETSAGSLTDPNNLLRVSLDGPVRINVVNQPAIVVFNQLNAKVGVEFGYEKGLDREKLVTVDFDGTGRDGLMAVGRAGGFRFEAIGPIQIRVMRAAGATVRKPPAEPPPAQHP